MTLLQALWLGIAEGLTEFLPVSSTGHLILVSHWMGLQGEAVKAFEVVIQAGALGAVLVLYFGRLRSVSSLRNLLIAFLPAGIAGFLLHRLVKEHLFGPKPVAAALAVGGLFMIWLARWVRRRPLPPSRELETLGWGEALVIGLAQCLALWPGTSRSMVTIAAGLLLGFSAPAAAEFSFLLAVPTLGAATAFDLMKNGSLLARETSMGTLAIGFMAAAVTAGLAVRGFVSYLNRRGLAPFGWYRLILALVVFFT